jgi:formylglycine-generating enzyme required for sulfatase activity
MQGRRILLLRILLLLFPVGLTFTAQANNLVISNVSLTGQNTAEDYCYIRFDISWENSWRTSSAPNNWDAAWIFAKYRIGSGTWNHVMLNTTGNLAPDGSTLQVPADEVGAFFYRSADGSGTFSKTGVKLRWNYGEQGIGDDDVVDIKVFGLEMVYVPQGAFWVGSGGTGDNQFYKVGAAPSYYKIENENEIIVGTDAGNLYYVSGGVDQGDQAGPVPAAFPKGFNAFYSMKYELTQQQYVDFLNALPRSYQNNRTTTSITGTDITNVFVLTGTASMSSRNGVRCDSPLPATGPVHFYCDYNQNGSEGDADDGREIACNFINWADLMAYLDWSGLRPMTEFEFEKICRGPLTPVPNEYAWGLSSGLVRNTGITDPGTINETSANNANVSFKGDPGDPTVGQLRVGAYAKNGTSRTQSGASYYGAMEMSGNTWERPVTIGNATGRTYTGLHGDGNLSTLVGSAGDANVSYWPGEDATGGGFRGGWWNESNIYLRVSARGFASHVGDLRRERMGGRGVRTASTN